MLIKFPCWAPDSPMAVHLPPASVQIMIHGNVALNC